MVTLKATSQDDTSRSGSATATIFSGTSGFVGVLTAQYDISRTGQNRNETKLTLANVNSIRFGKVFSYSVDGDLYAQPLYVPNVQIPGQGTRNVVYVATEHDTVYAFDADFRTTTPLWKVSFINPPAITTVSSDDTESDDIVPEIGITGTPVIDPTSGTLYVVARTKEIALPSCPPSDPCYVQRLHVLDIATGSERRGSPVVIKASVPGTGDGSDASGQIPFNALRQNQRSALLLYRGAVYVAWASHNDKRPYHGWVLGYDAVTLQQASVYNTSPNDWGAGIWQSGGGPSADANGNIYVTTGNGRFDAYPPCTTCVDFGDSVLRLSTNNGGLAVADYFTPFNQADLDLYNFDLGSGSAMLLPDQTGTAHPHLLLTGGKEGKIYLLDRDNLGQFHPAGDQILQSLEVSPDGTYGTPSFWENNIYVVGENQPLKQYKIRAGMLTSAPVSQSVTMFLFPCATATISSNGSADGIVWALGNHEYVTRGPAVLHAYDATDVSRELYNSAQAGSRDWAGPSVKFTVPTVANGRVYIGTQTELSVYGLLP
jgi:hypothetical protein